VVAGQEYRNLYADLDEFSQNHFGCISAMDTQIGRLRKTLRDLNAGENSMFWFCADNGPEGVAKSDAGKRHGKGSAGQLRGRKRDLFEGGIRVPGILEWPEKIKSGQINNFPCSTSDYFPTIVDTLKFTPKNQPKPVDGLSLFPMLTEKMKKRPKPIAFQSAKQLALIDNQYKIISINRGESFMLFDLDHDPGEQKDLAKAKPDLVAKMRKELKLWQESCRKSLDGEDYL